MIETITISRAEYDRLIGLEEDVSDAKSLADFVAKLAAGEEELVPAAVADRLIDGENPVKVWREHRGLSQSELARRANVNRVVLADIESGRRRGSIPAMRGIAEGLGVTIDDLI
jgi:DNA-binding XRE family transcriptional regulator